jgi:dihydroflavonol-4-reductase
MRVLVTGGTGLVGNNILRVLTGQGHSAVALVRQSHDGRAVADLPVELRVGDLSDPETVTRAIAGTDAVIHAAGDTHIGRRHRVRQFRTNVDGTRHVATAAFRQGVRMILVSSVDALPASRPGHPANEETPGVAKSDCGYVQSKRAAEREVEQLVGQGLDACIVNPGFMLGPWDWKPSSGRMLLRVARGGVPLAPRGGFSVCDVRDVSQAIVTALERGRAGRRYILAGDNMRYLDLWRIFARVTGVRPPLCPAGPLLRLAAGWGGDLAALLTGREGDVNSAAVRMSSLYHYYSSQRAERELAYRRRAVEASVRDAWQWFQENGYA